MNKKVMKILSVMLLAVMIVCSFSQIAFAAGGTFPSTSVFDNASTNTGDAEGKISSFMGGIIKIARYIGVAVAVLMLIILAIKYISAAPSEKAEIKKSAVIYVVGAVMLFAASGILTIIQAFATNLN